MPEADGSVGEGGGMGRTRTSLPARAAALGRACAGEALHSQEAESEAALIRDP